MEFVTKVGDILHLDNNEAFQVAKQFEYEGEAYLCIISIPEDIDDIFEMSKRYVQIVREVVDENDEFFVEEIEDKELLAKLEKHIGKK